MRAGATHKDKIRNEHIRGTTRVTQASKNVTERGFNWCGNVMMRYEEHIVRKVSSTDIRGKRGRPKPRFERCKLMRREKYWTESGQMAAWSRQIISYTCDPIRRGKPRLRKLSDSYYKY